MAARTPTQLMLRRFRRNPLAWFAVPVLTAMILLALLAPLLAPDPTPNANLQLPALANQPPGTQAYVYAGLRPSTTDEAVSSKARLRQADVIIALDYATTDSVLNTTYGGSVCCGLRPLDVGEHLPNGACVDPDAIIQRYFVLGTDGLGRDVLSRLLLGARVSLGVGALAVLVSLTIGTLLGLLAGYFRGWVDEGIQWMMGVLWSLPALLLALAIAFVLGRGIPTLVIAIGLATWVELARVVRGQVLSLREREFISATTALALPTWRVLFKHLLPNLLGSVLILSASIFATAVLLEAGLSFLGLGVAPPTPSWGAMIFDGYRYLALENGRWLALAPGLAIILLILALNLLAIALRDALDGR